MHTLIRLFAATLKPFRMDFPEETIRRHARAIQFLVFTLPMLLWIPLAAIVSSVIIETATDAALSPVGLNPQEIPFQLLVVLAMVVVWLPLSFILVAALSKAVYLIYRAAGGFGDLR
jgi:hypothetical protein